MALLPMVARSSLNAPPTPCGLTLANSLSIAESSRIINRVQCSSSLASSRSNSAGSRVRCSASRVMLPPLPAVDFQVVEEDDIEELTFLDDTSDEAGSIPSSSKWLTREYLSLRLRCSSLMMKESSEALSRHFKGRVPPRRKSIPDETTRIKTKPAQIHDKQLHLIRESFQGPVEFIRDVVIADVQDGLFEDLTRVSSEGSK